MPNQVLTNDFKRLLTDALRAGGTPLLGITHRLASAGNPTPTTKLADLTECVFTGYAAVRGNDPSAAYIDSTDGFCKAKYPTNLFQATDGAAQRLSTTLRGPITMAGTITAIVTAAGMPGSPRTVTVAVLTTDTDADLAEKVEEALIADADVGPFFYVASSGNTLTIERRAAAANDATMQLALADGTAVGLTAQPTAHQDRAGTAPGGAFASDTATVQYATDDAGTMLLWAERITPVSFALPGQGVDTALVYVHGA